MIKNRIFPAPETSLYFRELILTLIIVRLIEIPNFPLNYKYRKEKPSAAESTQSNKLI